MKLNNAALKYESKLDLRETEVAIKKTKDFFESNLAEALDLTRVSAPIFVKGGKGINDDLAGNERIVSFDALDVENERIEIVQSLAKWKRMALKRYGFSQGEGLYTDMNAIRRDETLDNLHSLYVDQWDWEKVISRKQRNVNTLRVTVEKIYDVIKKSEIFLAKLYPVLNPTLPKEISFISSQELEDLYSDLSPKEREDKITKRFGAVFITQIGHELRSGQRHDSRSPDYDDWNLNGDLLLWYPPLERAIEITSMGIRVDEKTLLEQLKLADQEQRTQLEYHQTLLNKELPYTIGGGIGQSRLCMFLLQKIHIGEVQVSVWNEETIEDCLKRNIHLL
ncbi:aspartate--ammonia ligase [Mesobacillus selenatarsenatis SF-1]|uniref:Aspartate--ammonia ligase n=1 Tax=Mesobacillus selenatarsenatis (strain DSM 18680 / JCM 14380 / FERM P-15431 / SF-1) TaxID=1321606 RepID=A0A0A8X8W5_MESS1|nr:aspartate--ammonia ligase [Mesobacillus selenatarsenatis SF-1]